MEKTKISSFTDLIAWKEGHQLVLAIFRITDTFPVAQRYGLTSQMQRAAISVTSNIAEGFARRSRKESKQFFFISLGSVTELQNQLLIARDIGYITNEIFQKQAQQTILVSKLLNGLIKTAA